MKTIKVERAGVQRDVCTHGEDRGTLYLPPEHYARADDDPYANTDFSLDDVDVGDFITNMCECRNYGLMVHVVALAVIRHDDGTVALDIGNSNLELFGWFLRRLPRYDAAATGTAKGTVERDLVLRAIDTSKQTRAPQRASPVFPGFVAPGASKIRNELNCAVVPDFGSMKLLDDRLGGDGERTPCVQFDYNAGYGTCVTKEPLAVVYADAYAIDYEGKEEPSASDIFNLIAGSILHGLHIVADRKPSPVECVRSAVALFAAVAAFLPPSFELARPRAFGDSEVVFKCGPGTWDVRIISYSTYCWVVFAAQCYGLRFVVPDRVRERDAAEHAADHFGLPSKRAPLQAQLTKLLPAGGLGPDDRRKVVELIGRGFSRSDEAAAFLSIVETDESLRVLYYFVTQELKELGAAARGLVVPRMKIIVGDERYEQSVAVSEAMTERESINIASVDLTFVAYSERLGALEAAAARDEASSLPVRLDLALTVVLEDAEGKKASFFDIRYAVSRQISDAFPAEAAELASAAKCAVSKVLARKVRAHKGGAGMDLSRPCLLGYRVKPADESSDDEPVGLLAPPVDIRSERSRSRDEEPDSDDSGADSGGCGDSSGDEWAP